MSRWVLAALLAMSGCAFALDGPDPNRPRDRVPVCDTSKGMVALDGVMATALGVVTIALLSENEPAGALLPLSLGALYVGGAISGNRAVDACRKAHDDYGLAYNRESLAEQRRLLDDADRENVTVRSRPEAQPAYVPPAAQQPQLQPPQPPMAQPPVAQPVAQPGAQQQPQPRPQPRTQPAKRAPADDEGNDWSDFWREVP